MKVKYKLMASTGYQQRKCQRMRLLKEGRKTRQINTAKDYFALANGISGKSRIDARVKAISKEDVD